MLKIRDLPLHYGDDQVLGVHIALSFEYKNDEAVCLPQKAVRDLLVLISIRQRTSLHLQ